MSIRAWFWTCTQHRSAHASEYGHAPLSASFHSCTFCTVLSYRSHRGSCDRFVSSAWRFAASIHGWRSSLRAPMRRLGSFWKHCMRKSRATGEANSGRGGLSSLTMRKRAGIGSRKR